MPSSAASVAWGLLAVAFATTTPVNAQRPGGGPPGWSGAGQSAGSPAYNYMYQFPLPIPQVATPTYTTTVNGRPIQFYEVTIQPFTQQVYPNLGPAHLVGYSGTAPGPTFLIDRGTESIIRYLNNGEENAAVHLHGSYTHSAWDGWAKDEIPVGQYKDYYYPNSESGRSIWYHDHADGITASNAYYGQAGCYIIHDPAEDALGLPSGKYDVPLTFTDKIYQSNGDLASPNGNPINFFGDIMHVNGQPWPYLSVEPRKYRFRLFDMSLSRPYDIYFADASGNWIDFQVIASDSGLLSAPVATKDVTIAMGERYEVVIDFAAYAGQNITVGNNMQNPMVQEFDQTHSLMRIVVGNTVTDNSNNGAVPSVLNGNIAWPTPRSTVDRTFNFQMGGEATWTINGIGFADVNNRILAKPVQGSTELWELRHTGGPGVHPVHIHLVNMQVISRTGGSRGVLPYEAAGLKDIVLLEPGEVVHVLALFGPENGVYMFHCHNLIHEDNMMMDAFNVTLLEALGYTNVVNFADPLNSQFAPKQYNAGDYSSDAVSSAVASLANLGAYSSFSALGAAETSYYATAGSTPTQTMATPSATAAPVSSGYGFATSTATASTAATQVFTPVGHGVAPATHSTARPTSAPMRNHPRAFIS